MKYFSFIIVFFIQQTLYAQNKEYFTNETLRIDLTLGGNHSETNVSVFELKKEPFWGGAPISMDPFEYGTFKITVKDSTAQHVLFSRGFCTLFEEWQTTNEAILINRSFQQTVVCPFPKYKIWVGIEKRDASGVFHTVFNTYISPKDFSIIKQAPSTVETHKLIDNGNVKECVDIAFIGDGYSMEEMDKFHEDIKRLTGFLFKQHPFNKLKNHFNIWAIDAVSKDSGMTDPRKDIWKNTAVKSSFNTLNSDRYLESTHTYLVRDYAGLVPYDQIYVIANTNKYGGGGIYNHFSLTSVDHKNSHTVFVHEFGHSFAGLGDEYYTSSTSYNDFYNQKIEPWQPNLTTMVDFKNKWKGMIEKTTPIPTPPTKDFHHKVGAFEGGGYVAKGIFRPYFDCRMKSNEAEGFCPVCQKAIEEMVLFLIGKENSDQ